MIGAHRVSSFSNIAALSSALDENNKRLKAFSSSLISLVDTVDGNSDNIQVVMRNQNEADKKLEAIMMELSRLNSSFSNHNNINNNMECDLVPQSSSSTLASKSLVNDLDTISPGQMSATSLSPQKFFSPASAFPKVGKPPRAKKSKKSSVTIGDILANP